jgi:hypothetical protein
VRTEGGLGSLSGKDSGISNVESSGSAVIVLDTNCPVTF